MYFSELLGIIGIVKYFIAELLACKVEYHISHNIVAVVVSFWSENSVNLSAEDILR